MEFQTRLPTTFKSTMAKPSISNLNTGIKAPRKVAIKSRNRIFGKVASKDEILAKIVDLSKRGLTIQRIAEEVGKDRTTIWRYLDEAEKKGLIQKTTTGRVEVSEQVQQQKQWEAVQIDDFVKNHPAVETWVNDMMTRKNGKPIKNWRGFLSNLKTICDTLELSPYAIIAGADNTQRMEACRKTLEAFALAVNQNRVKYGSSNNTKPLNESGFRSYKIAVRSFAMTNGVNFPRGISGLLSGKKVGYGKYAHVKLTMQQLDDAVMRLGQKYGYASKEQAAFIFYYLTCARNQAGAAVEMHKFSKTSYGWLACEVYESKTDSHWTKLVPSDNPHQQTIIDYLEKRKGARFMFIDSEAEKQKFGQYISDVFKALYREMGLTEPYFYTHPVHALRHTGAHYWLDRLDYNHALVCEIGGWKNIATLYECYGKPPAEFLIRKLTGSVGAAI